MNLDGEYGIIRNRLSALPVSGAIAAKAGKWYNTMNACLYFYLSGG